MPRAISTRRFTGPTAPSLRLFNVIVLCIVFSLVVSPAVGQVAYTLLAGFQGDEAWTAGAPDFEHYVRGDRGLKLTSTNGAVITSELVFSAEKTFPGQVELKIWPDHVENIAYLKIWIYPHAAASGNYACY